MLSEMPPWEWADWQQYNIRHPIGNDRFDLLFAMLAKMIADFSQVLDHKKYPQGVPIEEFLPAWAKPKPVELTVNQSVAWVVGFVDAMGGIDLRGQP